MNRRALLLMAAAGPSLVWMVASATWLAAAALGRPAGFDGRSMTLAEATAVASYADASRLLDRGADPNAPGRVRRGILDLQDHTMTPLEAATGAVRTGPLQMLIEHGAVIDHQTFPVLWCGALARGNQEMLRFLQSRRSPEQSSIDCSTVPSLW